MSIVGMSKRNTKRKDVGIRFVEARKMTDAEVESVASLLFTWWRREYEQEMDERMQSKGEKR